VRIRNGEEMRKEKEGEKKGKKKGGKQNCLPYSEF